MQNINKIINSLTEAGVHIYLDDGKLKTKSLAGALNPSLIELITSNKKQLIEEISNQEVNLSLNNKYPPIKPTNRTDHLLPTSFAQQRLWFIDKMDNNDVHYNMPYVLDLIGPFKLDLAEQVFKQIIQRHESLRTVFKTEYDKPWQLIQPQFEFKINPVNLIGQTKKNQNLQVEEAIKKDALMAFDLNSDLMLRASCLTLSEDHFLLLLNFHHIAFDGWSMDVFVKEFSALYEALLYNKPNPLTELNIQYADFVVWQNQWLKGSVLDKQLDYWSEQLAGLPEVHSIPLDFNRPLHPSNHGALHLFRIDAQTLTLMKQVALENQVTFFMLVHAVFSVLIARFSNNNDVVVGTPVANRQQKQIEDLIGFFANTLVLRTDCDIKLKFNEYLQRVQQTHVDAQVNQDVPFEYLVDRLNPQRSTRHNALFQILLMMDGDQLPTFDLPEVEISKRHSNHVPIKFELTLNVSEVGGELKAIFQYNTDLFKPNSIQQLATGFEAICKGITQNSHEVIGRLPLYTKAEGKFLIEELNQNQHVYPDNICVHHLFEQHVIKTPDNSALIMGEKKLTFKKLNELANQLSHHLIELLTQEQHSGQKIIGLCTERSIEMMIGILAILKSGSAYLPIDPSFPTDRIKYMVKDSGITLMLTQEHLLPLTSKPGVHTLVIDETNHETPWINCKTSDPAIDHLNPNELAYVIYTSGTTGLPKGVLQTHRTLVNLVHGQVNNGGLCEPIKTLQFAPFYFDVSIQEISCCWFTGSPLVLITQEAKNDLSKLPLLLQESEIERLFLPPAVLNWLADDLLKQQIDLPNLKELIVAGETLVVSSALKKYLLKHTNCRLWNHYGPTETHVATISLVDVKNNNVTQSIGHVLPNLSVYVLDELLQAVPLGAVGELYIGGAALAQGYLNQHQLTQKSFIPNPFSNDIREIVYRTGDFVRYLENGELEFIGRIDDQVKIRGFRVELGEIEQQLNDIHGVKTAVVVLQNTSTETSEPSIVAYVCATQDQSQNETTFISQLLNSLKQTLPDYMLPEVMMLVDKFPLTANGKVNRKLLPVPQNIGYNSRYIAPQTETESELLEIWSKLLHIPASEISTQDQFFQLGGHSLLTVKLITEVRAQMHVELTIRGVFECPELQKMAQLIDQSVPSKVPDVDVIDRRSEQLETSLSQQRLWFIDQMEGGSSHYNMTGSLEVEGDFDLKYAEQAFHQIIERHEPLRTVFNQHNNQAKQQIQQQFNFSIETTNLSDVESTKQSLTVNAVIERISDRVFDLSSDLMIRAHYLQLDKQRGILVICIHHIAFDGWSIAILMREFSDFYRALKTKQPHQLQPLTVQYVDYAYWQRTCLSGESIKRQMSYWEHQLADLPQVHNLPLDYARPKFQTFNGALFQFNTNTTVLSKLKQLANQQQSTLFMVIHAVFSILVSRHSNHSDVVMGTPVANRLQKSFEPMIGFFVNNLVLRTDCSTNLAFIDFLEQVKQTHIDAQANQEVPFEQLVERLNPERNTSHDALFQIMICMNNNEKHELTLPDVKLTTIENNYLTAKYDLTLFINEGENLELKFEYNTDLFTTDHIKSLADGLVRLLTAVSIDPSTAIHELPLLSKAEEQHILTELNSTQTDFPDNLCMHQLFEQQVMKTPDNIALIYRDEVLTYKNLNKSANQLAHKLIDLNVVKDDLVGLFMERSTEMMVSILAVMKAGAAYLPLDPSYPAARLEFMLDDSQANVILTQDKLVNQLQNLSGKAFIKCVLDEVEFQDALKRHSNDNPEINGLHVNNLAYAIYTSGSTGLPKGVLVEHLALVNRIDWMQKTYQLNEQDVVLQKTPFSFDVSVWEFTWYFTTGAKLVMAEADGHKDAQYLTDLIQQQQITTIHFVPSMLRSMLNNADWKKCRTLSRVFCSGEALSSDLPAKHYSMNSAKLHNLYGPTEAAIDVSYWPVPSDENLQVVPIGKPIQNIQLYILNEYLQLQPKGSPGELYIAGTGLARAYLNQPTLTAEKFIDYHMPGLEESIRLYRTGDLVRYLNDGNIEFLGRVDHQVKLRGFRIELGEIDHQIMKQNRVLSAITIIREDDPGVKKLVSYFTSEEKDEDATIAAAIRADLQTQLPDYMVPIQLVRLERLPLSANGKIDRKALPKPLPQTNSNKYIEPVGHIEKALVKIWSELLHVPEEEIGVGSNFFSLGGDSILSIQVTARALKLGLKLSVKQIFEHQTIRELSPYITEHKKLIIQQSAVSGSQHLLPIQHSFFEHEESINHYNQALIYKVASDLSQSTLTSMLTVLLERHDVLRLRFHRSAQNWQATYEPFDQSMVLQALEFIEINDLDFNHLAEYLKAYHQSLSICDGPIFRVIICKNTNQETRLIFIFHHLVMDGVSWRILNDDIELMYQQWQENLTLKLPNKTSSYQAWGQFIYKYSAQQKLQDETVFWLEILQYKCPELPQLTQKNCSDKSVFSSLECVLNSELTEKLLNKASLAYRTQINELLLSALLSAIYSWTGQNALRVDVEGHGRENLSEDLDLSQTMGWFTSIYPALLKSDSMEMVDLICNIKESMRRIPNRGLGFGILKYINKAFDDYKLDNSPILFNYLGRFSDNLNQNSFLTLSNENIGALSGSNRLPDYNIIFNGAVMDGCLSFKVDYNQSNHNESQIKTLLNDFIASLTEVILHCEEPDNGQLTPADFPLCQINQHQLNHWQSKHKIQDIYPSTAMQQGLLYHSEIEPSAYVSQLILTFDSKINLDILQQSWDFVVNRHNVFKTCFITNQDGESLQLVTDEVKLPWLTQDLTDNTAVEQKTIIEQNRFQDKLSGFNTSTAPLIRVQLWQLAENHHQMMISNHHSLLDGWSFSLVFKEVLQVYGSLISNQAPQLKPAANFRNYIKWLGEQDTLKAQHFWQGELAEVEGVCHLDKQQLRKSDSTFESKQPDHLSDLVDLVTFNQQQTESLKHLAQKCHVTSNSILQAAWAYLLSKYCQMDQVVFGTTVSGRPAELTQVEELVGLFINTIPVVTEVDYHQNLYAWIQSLHQQQINRNEYSYLPLFDIQALCNADQGENLLGSLFVFENYPIEEAAFTNNSDAVLNVSNFEVFEQANYNLSVMAAIVDGALNIKIAGKPSYFTKAQVQSIARHFTAIISQMLLSDDLTSVSDLQMLSEDEIHHLMHQLNNSDAPLINQLCIHQQFEQQVETSNDQLAVYYNGQSLSYAMLNQKANRLASYLIENNAVKPDDIIGLCVGRSLDMMVALLAVLKASCAYLPLDPSYPKARLEHMMYDSAVSLIITQSELIDVTQQAAINQIVIDDTMFAEELSHYSEENPIISSLQPNHLAYVIYTSGSTGMPKGVMLEHQGAINLANAQIKHFSVKPESNVLHFASINFDAATSEWMMALLAGASLYICPQSTRQNPKELTAFLQQHHISHATLPPAVLQHLNINDPFEFEALIVAGEAFDEQLSNRWGALYPFFNAYGPSEVTVCATISNPIQANQLNIGHAIDNTRLYLLDRHRQLIHHGAIGELHIAGTGLSRGYINQPQLTEQMFFTHTFSDGTTERLYKTGDLLSYNESNKLVFIGRTDHQIKIRGHRIELGEIEQQLSSHDEVQNALVMVEQQSDKHSASEHRLIAYVTTGKASQADLVQQLRDHLKRQLPDYMMPAAIMVLLEFPLTSNGKIDRNALPKPEVTCLDQFQAPVNETQTILAEIWAQLLKIPADKISINANFFDLGGHSLMAVKLITKIGNELNVQLKIKALFEASTLADLSAHIEMLSGKNSHESSPDSQAMDHFEI